jgi:energy-converting hydrogenase Eha subunit E
VRPQHGPNGGDPHHRGARRRIGYISGVFLFFSNRLGCLGSIALSVIVTLVLIAVLQLF